MPRTRAALRLTDAYRRRQVDVRDRALLALAASWRSFDVGDVDGSVLRLVPELAGIVTLAKRENAAASPAYLAEFVALELDEAPRDPEPLPDRSTLSSAGVPLAAAIAQVGPAVKWALRNGKAPAEASTFGFTRLATIASSEIVDAGRDALHEAMLADDRVAGFRRVVYGTCGACLGRQGQRSPKRRKMRVHPYCKCMTEPIVRGVDDDRVQRPTGEELFARQPLAKREAAIGKAAAEGVRRGDITLRQLGTFDSRGHLVQRALPASTEGAGAARAARQLIRGATRAESKVTADLQRIGPSANGELAGLQFRLKTEASLARKISKDLDDNPTWTVGETQGRIYDALRYTYQFTDRNYVAGVRSVRQQLTEAGYVEFRTKNFWTGDGYAAVQSIYRTPDGQLFELQFHTRSSLVAKDPSHVLFEAQRQLPLTDPGRVKIQLELDALWGPVRMSAPPGVKLI